MTICHETPSGQRNTLILPRNAALRHLLQHPLDTLGECSNGVTAVETTTASKTVKKAKKAAATKEKSAKTNGKITREIVQ